MAIRRRKKEKQQENIEICPGITLDRSFYRQKENRLLTLLLKGVLVYLLVMGSMGCYLSAMDIDYSAITIHVCIFLVSVFCSFLYYNHIWENIGYILLFLIVCLFAYQFRNYINSGFYAVLNDTADITSGYFNTNAMRSYGEQIGNRYLAITIAMSFIGSVCCILLNVLISRKMQYAIAVPIATMFLLIPLYMELNPSRIYSIMLLVGILPAFVIKRGKCYQVTHDNVKFQKEKKGFYYTYDIRTLTGTCLLLAATVFLVIQLTEVVYPVQQYQERYSDSRWKEGTKDTVGNLSVLGIAGLLNFYPNTGGLTNGKLGGVSAVNFDYNTDLKLRLVPYTYDRMYLKTFTGVQYQPYSNRWSRGEEEAEEESRCQEASALKKAFRKNKKYSARGILDVQNIAAATGYYLPYYSSQMDQVMYPGETKTYEFYPFFEECETKLGKGTNSPLWLDVPDENLEAIAAFCLQAGLKGSADEIVRQLTSYYQDNIPYTLRPGATPHQNDFVNFFLTKNRKGYCAHFASAATLIFRFMGIPARYVEGYAIDYSEIAEEGELLRDEAYSDYYSGYSPLGETGVISLDVTDASAHAWVEIYDKEQGWQAVEMTPYSEEIERQSFWDIFINFIGGRGSDSTVSEEGNRRNDLFSFDEETRKISLNTFLIVGLLFVLAVAGQRIFKRVQYQRRYYRSNRNDRAVMHYQRMAGKYKKRYPEFAALLNYREQAEWLNEKRLFRLLPEEEDRLVRLMEQAGFSAELIKEADMQWIKGLLENKKRK